MLKRLILALLVAWAATGFLFEVNAALAGYDEREQAAASPLLWRPGMPEISRLERCLAPARRAIPPGTTAVIFASPDEPPGAASIRWRWAAYLMPAHDMVPADPVAAQLAGYAIACGAKLKDPRFVPLRDLPGGRLYRVRRP